jgi:hypothetical protein
LSANMNLRLEIGCGCRHVNVTDAVNTLDNKVICIAMDDL